MEFHPTHKAYFTQFEADLGPGTRLHGSGCDNTNPFYSPVHTKSEHIHDFMQQCFWQGTERVSDDVFEIVWRYR
eukprot:12920100-Prorocentrum_lima.AAC.1